MKNKVILSIISLFIIIPLFIVPVAAQTTNVQTTNHGTITYEVAASTSDAENIVLNFGLFSCTVAGKKVSTVTYELDNYYTGTITFQAVGPYFGSSGGTNYNCELYLSNCTIVERNEDKLTVYIKEQRELAISIVRNNSGQININDWYQIYSETLTAAGSELNTLNGILAYCSFINDDTLDIAVDVEAIRTYMGYSNVSDTVHSDLNAIKSFIETLGTKYDTMNGKITSIQSYVIHIDQVLGYINTKLNQLRDDIQKLQIPEYSLPFYEWIMNNRCYVDNVYDSTNYYWYRSYVYNASNNVNSYNTNNAISVRPGGKLYVAFYSLYENDAKFYGYYYNPDVTYTRVRQIQRNRSSTSADQVMTLQLYEVQTKTVDSYEFITMEFSKDTSIMPVYIGEGKNMPIYLQEMLNLQIDNMYTLGMKSIVEAINDMSLNVNQLTVNATGITYNTNQTQVTNSVTNYNTNINQVFNIENTLSTDFNTYNQQFNPDFTDALTSIQTAPDVMNGIMVSMYDLPFIKYPLLITLAGIVLLAFLGV